MYKISSQKVYLKWQFTYFKNLQICLDYVSLPVEASNWNFVYAFILPILMPVQNFRSKGLLKMTLSMNNLQIVLGYVPFPVYASC